MARRPGGLIDLFQRDGQPQLPGRLLRLGSDQLAIHRCAARPVADLLLQSRQQCVIAGVARQRRRVLHQGGERGLFVATLQLATGEQHAQLGIERSAL